MEGSLGKDGAENHSTGAEGLVLRHLGGAWSPGPVCGRVLRSAARERACEALHRLLASSTQSDL